MVWYRLYESVPCQDEVREYEQQGSEGKQCASLEHGGQQHEADQDSIDRDSGPYDTFRGTWDNPCEYDCKQADETYDEHGKVAFGL